MNSPLRSLAHPRAAQPTESPPVDVLFVVSPHSLLLDIAGPAEAFRLANLERANQGLSPRYRLRFAGYGTAHVTSVGLTVGGLEPLPSALDGPTWVVVVGQPQARLREPGEALLAIEHWLSRTLHEPLRSPSSQHRLVTICSGALLAARAGLLCTRRCTTHHDLLADLQAMAPRAQVVANRVYVVDGAVATSAGVTAGIDLALHLIAGDCGEALAAAVAKDMVVYMRRSDRDPELSPFLAHRWHLHPVVHRVQDAVSMEPEKDWDMRELATLGRVTERHLLRLFVEHAGVSPLQFLQTIRLERARQSLERGANVTRAAELAGFRSGLQLRRAWHRHWGGSPRDALRAAGHRQDVPN